MRNAQGLPVNMIVLTALALLVLVVVGAFFISGFGQAGGSVNIVEADQSACNGRCQSMVASGFSLPECDDVEGLGAYTNDDGTGFSDMGCGAAFGPCYVTVQGGVTCTCNDMDAATNSGCFASAGGGDGGDGGNGGGTQCTVDADCDSDVCIDTTTLLDVYCDTATGACTSQSVPCGTNEECQGGACVPITP
ncbi:hypothetical protein GF352_04800 [archaeon]|nr:hypothetical protein [archaeon]